MSNTAEVKTKRVKKYKYLKVIQQVYAGVYGWEDCEEFECLASGLIKDPVIRLAFRDSLDNYRLMGYSTRVIMRKELIK